MRSLQEGETYFDDDGKHYGPDYGMTYIEFRFERSGQEDFHVKIGKSGDHRNNTDWLLMAKKSAVTTFKRMEAKADGNG